jgi:hypothetical protein
MSGSAHLFPVQNPPWMLPVAQAWRAAADHIMDLDIHWLPFDSGWANRRCPEPARLAAA